LSDELGSHKENFIVRKGYFKCWQNKLDKICAGNFFFATACRRTMGPVQPPIPSQWLRHEADHSPPFSAKVKMHGVISPLIIQGMVLS